MTEPRWKKTKTMNCPECNTRMVYLNSEKDPDGANWRCNGCKTAWLIIVVRED